MIGGLPTGTLPGVVVTATPHGGLSVTVHGRPARLALVDEAGQVLETGDRVAAEVEAAAVNCYRAILTGRGLLTHLPAPPDRRAA